MKNQIYFQEHFHKNKWGILLLFFLTLFIFSTSEFYAQDPLWMRYPSISPDGEYIVFSYQGNIYRVDSNGGRAIPLTMHPAYDFHPVWSNDGKSIAFSSNRYGNFDIFLIQKDGGSPKRLTFFSSDDIPYAFSSENTSVVFSSSRLDIPENAQFPTGSMPELYSIPVNGGRPVQMLTTPALKFLILSRFFRLLGLLV